MQEKETLITQASAELESREQKITELLKDLEKKEDELLSYSDKLASKETEYSEIQVTVSYYSTINITINSRNL